MREALEPFLYEHGVDAVFAGACEANAFCLAH